MADPDRKWLRQEFTTYAYILLYIALSSGQIFFNKVPSSLSIPCPSLMCMYAYDSGFYSGFSWKHFVKLVWVLSSKEINLSISSWTDTASHGLLLCFMFYAYQSFQGNTAYLYISVAFAQMLKAIILALLMFTLGDICSASCCFHSWCISWTRSDELQDASDNVGYRVGS
ncbi:UNVERIFIED_CONTAM: putative sugar phosphate/phosphate translocator [Sesamum radiatum]|uniref:Sugar phosphate/phosphate translocator n=1 Tax=Sesamum radiatum TaxID=300843 RepID=A0AAW2LNC6_SESRA